MYGWGWLDPVGRWVNLLILVGGLFYVLRIPASKFFDERRQGIRQQMQEAEMSRQEIEKKLADIENRLGNLDQELAEIVRIAASDSTNVTLRRRAGGEQRGEQRGEANDCDY